MIIKGGIDMNRYFNYSKMIKDLHALRKETDPKYHQTLKVMIDECVMHFFESYEVPFERQSEFLIIMMEDCPEIYSEYRNKKFN